MGEEKKRRDRTEYMRAYYHSGEHGSCTADGCDRPMVGRSGLCSMHYQRQRVADAKAGLPPLRERNHRTPADRLWARVDRGDLATCWPYNGARVSGYGVIRVSNRNVGAHRLAYELLRGPIPSGLEIDHLCRNRACCNPWHMEPVSQQENLRRGEGIAARNARKTHCKRGHPLSGDNLYRQPDGGRRCRQCAVDYQREYLRLKKLT